MTLIEIKESLQYDKGFRNLFPEYQEEIRQFIKDTSCKCNMDLYRKIATHQERISDYKSGSVVYVKSNPDEFKIINTNIEQLEEELKKIPIGSKVESLARFESEVTVILRIPR